MPLEPEKTDTPSSGKRGERARSIAEILAIIARGMSAKAHKGGLNPAQWSALRYFAGGLSHAPTSASFADYEGISRASANQTVRSMIDKGLLARSKIEGERRALKVSLTNKGESLLAEDPIQEVAALVEALSDEEQNTLSRALYRLAISMKA